MNETSDRLRILGTMLLLAASGCMSTLSEVYKFEVVNTSAVTGSRSTLVVRLVDVAAGQPVLDGEVFALRTRFVTSRKGNLTIGEVHVPLKPDGRGNFVYDARDLHPPETLWLAARVAGVRSLIHGTLKIDR